MKNTNPKKTLEKLETVLNAFKELAPDKTFGGVTLSNYLSQVNASRDSRSDIEDIDDQKIQAITKRDNTDETSINMANLIINGVVGDPAFGPDSALYEAMGYVRKSNRKSGLTRKKKITNPTT
jgi:hypothetical protein